MRPTAAGRRLDEYVAQRVDAPIPPSRRLGRLRSPLPEWLENIAFRLVWVVVAINLAGTVAGFWYYRPQLAETPLVMWPIVPVSPLATLYMALSLSTWRLGYDGRLAQLLHVLAFIGCLKYGLWAVFVQLFVEGPGHIHVLLWQFLIWSHVAMATQAFLVGRYARLPAWAVVVGAGWYVINDVLDFFVAVMGGPHHTWINELHRNGFERSVLRYDIMAGAAVVATIIAVGLLVSIHRHLRTEEL